MELTTAIALISTPAIQLKYATHWADLGCGTGLFTHVLSTLLHESSMITAIDKDAGALNKVHAAKGIQLKKVNADFINDILPLQELDGIMMANALHFVQHKKPFIKKLEACLKPTAALLIVEYDTSKPNVWVPYPLTTAMHRQLFYEMGYRSFELIHKTSSRFGRADIAGMLIKQ